MNILFVHEVDWLRKVVYDIHMLAEGLSLLGHNVYVIDYESMWEKGIDSPHEVDVSRVFPNAVVHLIRPRFIKVAGVSRASAFVSHYYAIGKVIRDKAIDAILLYSVPTNGLQTVYWARRYGIPVIFRSLDALNELVTTAVLRPITKVMERIVYSRVDSSLALTPLLCDYLVGLGANPERTSVLPIPVDTSQFCPMDSTNDLRARWGLQDKRVILFMGTLFDFSGLDKFLLEFKHVLQECRDVALLIVGDGSQRPELERIITNEGLQGKVVITGFQPYGDMPRYINLADVCINPFVSNGVTKDIFPGKTVQYLACGKPLVNTELAGMKSMIAGEHEGVVYVRDTGEMAKQIIKILTDDAWRWYLGKNGLAYASVHHSCDAVAKVLESRLVKVVER